MGGSLIGPKTPGSAWLALHGGGSGHDEKDAISGQVVGGMGSITQAMARCAEDHGVEILVNSDVTQVQTRNGRVHSVVTSRGDEYKARIVVGNLNAKVLFGKLVAASDLPSEFVADIAQFKTNGAAFKLNIACERAPRFSSFNKREAGMESPVIASRLLQTWNISNGPMKRRNPAGILRDRP